MPGPNQYKVSVPEPCHAGWEQMTPATQGRFCSSCQKVVRDFSTVPDEEIVRYLLTHKNVCGRISGKQQNRLMLGEPPQHRSAATLYQRIAASMLMLAAFTERSFAQPQKIPVQQQPARKGGVSPSKEISIKGTLNYFTKAAEYREKVVLRADTLQLTVVPDEHGAFEFHLPQSYLDKEVWISTENRHPKVEVIAQKITLYTSQTNVYLRQLTREEKQPELRREELNVEGVMKISPEYDLRGRYPFWQRLTRPFRRNKFSGRSI